MSREEGISKTSLRTIYLVVMTLVFAISMFVFITIDVDTQRKQGEAALVEEARVFAREMDAVWSFMDNSQTMINTTSDGIYEFKGLHCSIVGKSVGAIFSKNNNYTVRYTNFNPRSSLDLPDEFETEALTAFNKDGDTREYWGTAEFKGEEKFRYLQALDVNQSCLECHGTPVGELDITGHEKEGWTLDTVGGAISIVIPLDQQLEAQRTNIIRDATFFFGFMLVLGIIIFAVLSFWVMRPLDRMKRAFGTVQEGNLSVSLDKSHEAKEIGRVIARFNEMTDELESMYATIEGQVNDRTQELKKANELLERQRDDLSRLNDQLAQETKFKSDLLSMVNHELRTPLTAIITLAQLSAEQQDVNVEDARAAWGEIEKNSQVLLTMINDMLDIARSDAGVITATCEPMDFGDIVSSVRQTLEPLARRYAVELTTHVAPDVPLVNGDEEKMTRIIANLVSNAIKFTPDGGKVSVCVTCDTETGGVCVRVADTGIGIAPEDQERIFERFVQVDSTSTRKYNGSGLGLGIVREYAELQGFSVSVESELDKGSTFIVDIPKSALVGDDLDV